MSTSKKAGYTHMYKIIIAIKYIALDLDKYTIKNYSRVRHVRQALVQYTARCLVKLSFNLDVAEINGKHHALNLRIVSSLSSNSLVFIKRKEVDSKLLDERYNNRRYFRGTKSCTVNTKIKIRI